MNVLLGSFPALAFIEWDVAPKLKLGPAAFHLYGMLFACGIMFSYLLLRWFYETEGDDARDAVRLIVALVVGLFVGARLAHIVFYDDLGSYLRDPLLVLDLERGGLASHGGAVGVIVVMLLWARRRRIPFRVLIDRVATSSLVLSAFVRLGNLINSEIYGRATDVPWAFVFARAKRPDPSSVPEGLSASALAYLPDQLPRHPSQLYEALLCVVSLAVIMLVVRHYRAAGRPRPLGLLWGLMFVFYMGGRFVLEFFKEYLVFGQGQVTMGQWLSLPFFAVGVYVVWASLWGPWRGQSVGDFVRSDKPSPDPSADTTPSSSPAARTGQARKSRKRR